MKSIFTLGVVTTLFYLTSCSSTPEQQEITTKDSVTTTVEEPPVVVNAADTIKVVNTKLVDSLLKKPVTTPANNPFNLREKDNLILVKAFDKEPLKSRAKGILGDKFDDYVKFLAKAKGLKKDSDGFLYTSAKVGSSEAFFLYQHEKDVLFLGFKKDSERLMFNDMKSRMFFPTTVEEWADRPLE
jgi:hypothetical protein